tara:strand:+ start:2416 stop:3042 length:627 start_codon:yes stop_codon:yes gene_type:complete
MNNKITIKKSTKEDSNFFYEVRNNSENRRFSSNSKKINKSNHNIWFNKNYKKNYFYTCYYLGKKAGYIRGEKKDEIITISIAFLKKFQKKNIASKCFEYFEKKLKKNYILLAKVKNTNLRSMDFFYKNDFNLLNRGNNYANLYKISSKNKNNYVSTIDKIEKIRKGNNVNWMNILRIGFKYSPKDTSKVFKKIFKDDKKINLLSKKLF